MRQVMIAFVADVMLFALVFRQLRIGTRSYAAAANVAIVVLVGYVAVLGTLWISPNGWGLPTVCVAAACATGAMRGSGLAWVTCALGRLRLPLYLTSVAALAGLVFVLLPLRTFHTSPGELTVHVPYLMSVNVRDAMIILHAAALIYAIAITSRMRTALTVSAVGCLTVALLYTYVLPFGYPAMTGLHFEGGPLSPTDRIVRVLCDEAVLVVVALGLRAALRRYGVRPLLLGVLLATSSLVATAAVDIRQDAVGGAGGPNAADRLSERPLRFSRTHPNALLIFLDRFMGSYVESTLAAHPELAQTLSGFTWYPRTVSAGENSIAGVHPMLGGYDYLPDRMNARGRSLRAQSTEAFAILPYNFSQHGYRVNVVNPRGLGFTMAGDCSFLVRDGVYCSHIPDTASRRQAAELGFSLDELSASNYVDLLVLLGAMRAAPYGLKETLRNRGSWRPFMDHSAGTTFIQWAELRALPTLTLTDADESNFNFVSNILPHEPYYLGDDCRPRHEIFNLPDAELRRRGYASQFAMEHANAAQCALVIVADYLRFLKDAGVYDNTTIVIVSDHGIVGEVEDHSVRAVAGGTQENLYVRTRSLLLVKRPNSVGPLQTSETFTPNAEVPRILCDDIGGCVNPYLNNQPIATAGRDDPFVVSLVPWQFTLQQSNAFVIDRQLVLRGKDPFNAKNWEVVR